MQDWWLICVVMLGLAIFWNLFLVKTEKGRQNLIVLCILFCNWSFDPKGNYFPFFKTLSTILSSGVRIVEGLQLTRKVVGNTVMEKALDEAIIKVQDGDKLAVALERTGKFPSMVIHMLKTG